MTRSQAKALLPVISAWANGEPVQLRLKGSLGPDTSRPWIDVVEDSDTCFEGEAWEWRVKPGVFWVVINRMTAEVCCRHASPPKVDDDLYYVRREVVT